MRGSSVTVIATVGAGEGTAAGVVGRSSVTDDSLREIVSAAIATARAAGPAEDASPLVDGTTGADWDLEPEETTVGVFEKFAPSLGESLKRATAEERRLYGFAEPRGRDAVRRFLDRTAAAPGAPPRVRRRRPASTRDLSQSAWVGAATRDFTDIDALALDAELTRRLGWAKRTVSVDAGRHPTDPAAGRGRRPDDVPVLAARRPGRFRGPERVLQGRRRHPARRHAVVAAGEPALRPVARRSGDVRRSRSRGRPAARRASSTTDSRSRPRTGSAAANSRT